MKGRDARLAHVASRQFGVFSRAQALDAGFPGTTIRRRRASGIWLEPHPGVYHAAAAPLGWEGRGVAAWLACGDPAAIAGRFAAAFWGLGVDPTGDVRIVVPHTRRPRSSEVVVVRTRRWGTEEVVRLGVVMVTSVPRTLLDLMASGHEVEAERALDAAHRLGRVRLPRLDAYLAHPSRRRLPGAGTLRHLVSLRDPDHPIETGLETDLFAVLRRFRVPVPLPQLWVDTRSGRRRIDFAYPDRRLALEVDSRGWHGPDRFDDDRIRDNELADLGWERRHITRTMIDEAPAEVAWTVASGLGLEPVRWRG